MTATGSHDNGRVFVDGSSSSSPLAADEERLLLTTRIAWMYYMEGLKQDEVASVLGISRLKVNRLLAAAREEGLVRVEITSPYLGSAELEGRLREAFGLQHVVLVPTPHRAEQTTDSVGHALGGFLNGRLRDGMTVGVHHGRTVHSMFQGLRPARMPGLSVVSMKGSLSPKGRMIPHETVGRMALTLQASCYQLAAPGYARSPQERALFMQLDVVQSVLERAAACDVAILTASRVSNDGGLVSTGFMTSGQAAELRDCGAVGAVLGAFVDSNGRVVRHVLNDCRIGLDLDTLAAIPEVILTGGGPAKVQPFRAALRLGFAHTLVTDHGTARAILADSAGA